MSFLKQQKTQFQIQRSRGKKKKKRILTLPKLGSFRNSKLAYHEPANVSSNLNSDLNISSGFLVVLFPPLPRLPKSLLTKQIFITFYLERNMQNPKRTRPRAQGIISPVGHETTPSPATAVSCVVEVPSLEPAGLHLFAKIQPSLGKRRSQGRPCWEFNLPRINFIHVTH